VTIGTKPNGTAEGINRRREPTEVT
jgi:hypothetical protein